MRPLTAAPKNPRTIRDPVAAIQDEERSRRPDVQQREHRHERGAGLVEIETQQAWDDHRMAQRGHRKKLSDSLERGEEEDKSGAQHWPEPTSPSRVV